MKVCCGGIIGMGERVGDRLGMLMLLANLPSHPESVPINMWNEVQGVPVNDTAERPDPIALVRMIAVARIMMPKSVVRLSAGRQYMTDELQALCFVAGANSIFIGDVLLTTKNPQTVTRRGIARPARHEIAAGQCESACRFADLIGRTAPVAE